MQSNNNKDNLIAITALGSISALGTNQLQVQESYANPNHCFSNIDANSKVYKAAKLSDSQEDLLREFVNKYPNLASKDRIVQFALFCANTVMENLNWKPEDGLITGVNIGSSRGATNLLEHYYGEFLSNKQFKISPSASPLTTLGNLSSETAAFINANGPSFSTSIACSTALHTIMNSLAWIKSGMAHRFIVGGSEAAITPFTFAQTDALHLTTSYFDSQYPCTPFINPPNTKNSFVLGEGAALFAIEKIKREEIIIRKPLAIVDGYGFGFEVPPTLAGINTSGKIFSDSMLMAINNSESDAVVDYVLTHSPGTVLGDLAECNAIKTVFGNNLPNIFSNKWKIGHTYAASSALHTELAVLMLQNNLNLNFPYQNLFENKSTIVQKVMVNAAGFGGNSASVIFSKPELFL